MSEVIERARQAVHSGAFEVDLGSPYAAALLRARRALGQPTDPRALLDRWSRVHPGSAIGELRYRWPLTHKRVRPLPSWVGPSDLWRPWRPLDVARLEDPFELEQAMSLPAVICEAGELLLELADEPGPLAAEARALFEEAEGVMRRDFASFVRASSAWVDTFALWCLSRRPRLFARLQPFALAIATNYASTARMSGGVVQGTRYPVHGVPLVSASAHLARALMALGQELELVASLTDFVGRQMRVDGTWSDAEWTQDLLTTLAAADLLSHVDPSFDPAPLTARFAQAQSPSGGWTAFGPETPWLTVSILEWLEAMNRGFASRFRWPHLPRANCDHKTALPFFAWFDQIARLFASLPGLSAAKTELAFIDLAGFRAFNNAFGQEQGDRVLEAFAREIGAVTASTAIRDGGDEFLVVGAPTRAHLAVDLSKMAAAWPERFRAQFGPDVPPVAPRIVIGSTRGGRLREAREQLGREIGAVKEQAKSPPPQGVLVELAREL